MPSFTELVGDSEMLILLPHHEGEPFDSPFGPITRLASYNMCGVAEVKIGIVDSIDVTYMHDYAPNGAKLARHIYSVLNMKMERDVRGNVDNGSYFTIIVPGGRDPSTGSFERTSSLFPQPVIGRRYAVGYDFYANLGGDDRDWADGTPWYLVGFSVDEDVNLPSRSKLRGGFDDFCNSLPEIKL